MSIFAGGLASFQAGRKGDERAWCPSTPCEDERGSRFERGFPRWGNSSVPAKNLTRQDPQKITGSLINEREDRQIQ